MGAIIRPAIWLAAASTGSRPSAVWIVSYATAVTLRWSSVSSRAGCATARCRKPHRMCPGWSRSNSCSVGRDTVRINWPRP